MTTSHDQATAEPAPSTWSPNLSQTGSLVRRRIAALSATRATSSTTAALAQLRRAIDRPPGSVPEIWALTIADVPGPDTGDEPTREEWAVHLALCLFAIHQQGKSDPVQHDGLGLGMAVARLDRERGGDSRDGEVSPTRRRFTALSTATSLTEAAFHLRGIVTQLRSAGVPLDYGMLADDFVRFQRTGGGASVRLAWARQFYRTEPKDPPQSESSTEPENSTDSDPKETK